MAKEKNKKADGKTAAKAGDPDESLAAVTSLLKAVGVQRVVYVDDAFCARGVVNRAVDLLAVEDLCALAVIEDPGPATPENVVRTRVRDKLRDFTDEQYEELRERLQTIDEETTKELEAASALERILTPAGVELERLSLKKWRIRQNAEIARAATEKTLFVFDDDFRLEGFGSEAGRAELAKLHGQLAAGLHPFALLTHSTRDSEQEEGLRSAIVGAFPALANSLVVVSKSTLSEKPIRLPERFRAAFLSVHFEKLKSKLLEALKVGHEEATKQIAKLRTEGFAAIVFESSRREGAWPPDTLLRLFSVSFLRGTERALRRDQAIHELADGVLPVCEVELTEVPVDEVHAQAVEFQQHELYEQGEAVNAWHAPLELGDVIEVAGGGEWVLVNQPCDLMVRSEGFRLNEPLDDLGVLATLIPIEKLSSDEAKKANRRRQPPEAVFLRWYQGKDWSKALLSRAVSIPLWILDTCAYHADGKGLISCVDAATPPLTPPWRLRHSTLKAWAAEAAKDWKKVREAVGEERVASLMLRLPPKHPLQPVLKEPDSGVWSLDFGFRRVRRIKPPLSEEILSRFSHYMGRPGDPHDLTRGADGRKK